MAESGSRRPIGNKPSQPCCAAGQWASFAGRRPVLAAQSLRCFPTPPRNTSPRRRRSSARAIEGVAAPEAAVNADSCGAFVHLLALGIPASGSTAILMGAFIMYGIQPGPLLFQNQPDLVWGLIASMYVGNVMLLVLNLPLVGLFARVLYAPPGVLLVMILGIASIGVYSLETNPFMLFVAHVFGIIGYFFRLLDIPKAPLIFGIILGGKIEQSLRQAMTISSGDATVFLKSPLSAALLLAAVAMVVFSYWAKRKSVTTMQEASAQPS